MRKIFYYDFMMGKLGIVEKQNKICSIFLSGNEDINDFVIEETNLIIATKKQLDEYFDGKRKIFDLPLLLEGTDFQKKVWRNLISIPYGKTVTYKYIACEVGNEKACRAVGNANNKNPIVIIVPCHRVIGTNGKLVGYGAGGISIKEKLINLEKENL